MKKNIYALALLFFTTVGFSQIYDDYIGLDQFQDVNVSSSDGQTQAFNTINGSGVDLDIQGSSRFLSQATLGATIEDIQALTEIGIEKWIDDQMAIEPSQYAVPTIEIIFELYENCQELYGADCNQQFNLSPAFFRYAWWHNHMRGEDKLRQRISLALSEILVISDRSELENYPHGLAYYYDVLQYFAFGNYRDLLRYVTLNPSMGFYLSHMNNPRTIPSENIHPDENYAREIMQLFTIGLYELNLDGSRKTDPNTGLWIPTYDNDDIKELAKVFTGLSGSKWAEEGNTSPVRFGRNFRAYSLLDTMTMYEIWHEPGPKTIVGNYTIPGGLTGMQDVGLAINHLFNHDNVGPFLATRLIQRLVKSNPSPEYIERVATVFNDNGNGVRGDMAAFIKAILMDSEAMECYWFGDPENGMLREPITRYTQISTALKAETESEWYWNTGLFYNEFTAQAPLSSPTVFNFFTPDYVPDSEFAYYDMVGPEFQILNSSTSSNYVNFMMFMLMDGYFRDQFNFDIPNVLNEPFLNIFVEDPDYYAAELSDQLWLDLAYSPEDLVDYLDILLTNGQLSDQAKTKIVASLKQRAILDERYIPYYAAFLIMIDPDYVIMK
ncbi:MAG: DUF1800 family protein [Saprospiraceae bacterium]|nr:DUF1800 family protein [Saprospiraceae bacterium]